MRGDSPPVQSRYIAYENTVHLISIDVLPEWLLSAIAAVQTDRLKGIFLLYQVHKHRDLPDAILHSLPGYRSNHVNIANLQQRV